MKNNVSEQITIKAPKEKIIAIVKDLKKWQDWSPFHAVDPDAENIFSKENNGLPTHMSWKGKINGEGSMVLENESDIRLDFSLTFLKPFKSKAKSSFVFSDLEDDNTLVTWKLEGQLPFFLFFMKKLFNKMLSNDYKRGLKRLKHFVEQGKVLAKMEFTDAPESIGGFDFYELSAKNIHINDLPKIMSGLMEQAENDISKTDGAKILDGYCLYDNSNFLKDTFSFRCGFSVKGMKERVTSLPDHKAIKLTLYGPYEYLEDAWSSMMMRTRALKFKMNKKVPPYEKYITDPQTTKDPKDYITEVFIPVK